MKKVAVVCVIVLFPVLMGASETECGTPQSASGLSRATVTVTPGSDGLSVEQRNVRDRLAADNKPGSIKHLYVISAYSGQVLIYSTVRGKVTSSGKRLAPETVVDGAIGAFGIDFGGYKKYTNEVLSDDGTYGSSVPYVYWFDAKGAYHQHYVDGGQILHISDTPLAVKSIVLNMESVNDQ